MTLTKSGYFGWAGGGKNGASVDIWAASRFTSPPAENDPPPTGSPDGGPVLTSIADGGPGSYTVTVPSVQDYFVRVQYGGFTYWSACPSGTIQGSGGSPGTGTVSEITSSSLTVTNPTGPTVNIEATVGLLPANNLSDVDSAATSRVNLGLGSAAIHAETDFLEFSVQPSGDTTGATDYANITVAITAATAAGQTLQFPDGTYYTNGELPFTCSYIMQPGTTIKAASGYTGVLCSTPFGTSVSRLTFSGGVFDGNGTAQNCWWAHHASNCRWINAPSFKNAVQDDFVLADPTDAGTSFGNFVQMPFFSRSAGTTHNGYGNIFLTSFATDNVVIGMQGGVRDIGIRVDAGDNVFIDCHVSNGFLTAFLDNGSTNQWISPIIDTPGTVIHGTGGAGTVAVTNASNVVTDTNIMPSHAGLPVTGTGIPNGTFVGTVTQGVSFTLANAAGGSVNANNSGTSLNLLGVGFNFQGSTPKSAVSVTALNGNTATEDAIHTVACIGPSVPSVYISSMRVTASNPSFRWLQSFIGILTGVNYLGLAETNVSLPQNSPNQLTRITATTGTFNPFIAGQTISSGSAFTVSTAHDSPLIIPITTASYFDDLVTAGASVSNMVPGTNSAVVTIPAYTAGAWVVGSMAKFSTVPTGITGASVNTDYVITAVNPGSGTVTLAITGVGGTYSSGGTLYHSGVITATNVATAASGLTTTSLTLTVPGQYVVGQSVYFASVGSITGINATGTGYVVTAVDVGTITITTPTTGGSFAGTVALTASGFVTVTTGPSTGLENTILSSVPVHSGSVISVPTIISWKTVVTGWGCGWSAPKVYG